MNTREKTVLEIEGMTCGSCVHHVTTALCDLEGVAKVDVRLRDGEATVLFEGDGGPSSAAMIEALREAGYEARPKAA